ncbi:MAG: hypothetical protein QXK76_03060 [Candidatus Woesearchaeota archaeon]
MFKKKSQVIGQVFIFILAALIVGVIILIGYNAISKTISKSCQVEQSIFKTKIESLIESNNGYGSITTKSIIAPCGYEMVCFVDSTQIGTNNPLTLCTNKIIVKSISNGESMNIFLSTPQKTVAIGYSDMLRTDNPQNCTCIKQKSKNFNLKLIGIGKGTIVRDINYNGTSTYPTPVFIE